MKKIFLILLPFLLNAGSSDAIIQCKSATKRTLISFKDSDLSGNFQGGKLSIDGKSIDYSIEGDTSIVQDLKRGVYTLEYYDKKYSLTFYAIPKSVKNKSHDKITHYTFKAIITPSSTDPRTQLRLNKTIIVYCSTHYDWGNI